MVWYLSFNDPSSSSKDQTFGQYAYEVLLPKSPPPDTRYHKSQGYNPSEYRSIIERANRTGSENRYQSAKEMLEELEDVLNGNNVLVVLGLIKGYVYKYFAFVDKRAYFAVSVYRDCSMALVLSLVGFIWLGFDIN